MMRKWMVFLILFILIFFLRPYLRGTEISFSQQLTNLPIEKEFIIVYTDAQAEKVTVEYNFHELEEGKIYSTLNVDPKTTEGKWKIHVFPLSPGTRLYIRMTVTRPIDVEERNTVQTLVTRAVSYVIQDLIIPSGATGDENFIRSSVIFQGAISSLKKYRWKDQEGKIISTEEYLPKVILKNFPSFFASFRVAKSNIEHLKNRFSNEMKPLVATRAPPPYFKEIVSGNRSVWINFLKTVSEDVKADDLVKIAWERIKKAVEHSEQGLAVLDIEELQIKPERFGERLEDISEDINGAFKGLEDIRDKFKEWDLNPYLVFTHELLGDSIRQSKSAAQVFKEINDNLSKTVVFETTADTAEGEVPDLKFYFGTDTSVIGIPKEGEIQAFLNFAIFLKKQPENLELVKWSGDLWSWLASRVTPMFGFGFNLFGDSELPDQTYYLGLGFRLNKYTRLTAGQVFFEKQKNNNKKVKNIWALGLSFDARAFASLKNK